MKIAQIILGALFFFASGVSAIADVQAITDNSKEAVVANTANDIFSVTILKLGKWNYKIVSMDSVLNGDISSTTIVLVNEGGVGGEAGYEAAFQLSPIGELQNFKSTRIEKNEIALTFYNSDSKPVKKLYHYDANSKTLKESATK